MTEMLASADENQLASLQHDRASPRPALLVHARGVGYRPRPRVSSLSRGGEGHAFLR
jgi:hypothetical protein